MDTYAEIQAEALRGANSPEGYARLIEGLLWSTPVENPLVPQLREALRRYVLAKRTLELRVRKGVDQHWPWSTTNEMEIEHEAAQAIERALAQDIGWDEVRALKRQIGGSLQGLLRRKWAGNA